MQEKLSVKSGASASGILWALAVLVAGICNQLWPPYADKFLELAGSIYPGYRPFTGWPSVFVGAGYALVDGAIVGALWVWLYNRCRCCKER